MQRFENDPITAEDEMIAAIERHLAHMANCAMWTIGVTADPDARCAKLEEPPFWAYWRAVNEQVARNVERHFLEKGMRQDKPNEIAPTYPIA